MKKLSILLVFLCPLLVRAGNIAVPNYSFESPLVAPASPYATNAIDDWEKSPQPSWYDPSTNDDTPWDDLTGVFYNVPFPGYYIDNCDGNQAAFVFALPEVALFQDYDSVSGTNTVPTHAFNATYNVGRFYTLTVGLFGGDSGMPPGATFQLSLYYRDAATNMVTLAATNITNSMELFPSITNLVDFQVLVPTVQPGDAWTGQHIGIQLASTSGSAGDWVLDNVRLLETIAPTLSAPAISNGQFNLMLNGEPGDQLEIQASTNFGVGSAGWTFVGTVTNSTGSVSFTDTNGISNQRFYRLRQF